MGIHSGYRPSLDATVTTDEFAPYNVLLVNGSNYVSATQNNTFLDSSANRFSITRGGNTTQGSFSPYGNTWSNYFDGNGDYLTIPNDSAWAYGTGDFTVECWLYKAGSGSFMAILDMVVVNPGTFGFGTNDTQIIAYQTNSTAFTFTYSFPLNVWTHIAFVRSAGVLFCYVNGSSIGSLTCTNNFVAGSVLNIGRNPGGNNQFYRGYISNLRIVKGTAIYNGNFTPSTEPLSAISGTVLLTCQNNRFLDRSTNNFTVTRNGDVQVVKDSPFQLSTAYNQLTLGGSAYFDGSGDWLKVADNSAFTLGSGDFTIECWVYPSGGSGTQWMFGQIPTNFAFSNCSVAMGMSSYTVSAYIFVGSSEYHVTSTSTMPLNTWTHLAFTRESTNIKLYVNGSLQATTAVSTSTVNDSNANFAIGRPGDWTGGAEEIVAHMSDFRLVKGTAVYTSNFTPPTAPLTAITNTSLLLNFTNAAVIDQTGENVLETLDGAQVSRTQSKFENAVYFDGSGDYLSVRSSPSINLSSGNWTIESWVWWSGNNSESVVIDKDGVYYSTYPSYAMGLNGSGYARIIIGAGNVNGYFQVITSNTLLPTSTWVHLAAVKNGSTITLYQNGVSVASATQSGTIVDGGKALLIGYSAGQPASSYWSGYIDDLRITKGVARYTANFTPPARALPITRFG